MLRLRAYRAGLAALAIGALLTTSACYGPFNLTRTIYNWNGKVQSFQDIPAKWMQEAVFVALVLIPVYPFALIIDALFFNSVQFWTGENPIKVSEAPDGDGRIITAGDMTITMSAPDADGLVLVTYRRDGRVFARASLRTENGRISLTDAGGDALLSAEVGPADTVQIVDRDCRLMGMLPVEAAALAAGSSPSTAPAGPLS
jgi:hypothetical protein